jgi:glycosyltransferase involved in cell wall biosynthesis
MVAHGLPILVTSGPMMDKAFVHGKNVLTFAPKDPDALTSLLLEVMDHADLRERLRAGAVKLADEWFSWDSAIERTLAALRPQLSGKSV